MTVSTLDRAVLVRDTAVVVSGGEKIDEIGRLENRVFGPDEAGMAGGCSRRRGLIPWLTEDSEESAVYGKRPGALAFTHNFL